MTKRLLYTGIVLFVGIGIIVLRPIPTLPEGENEIVVGEVSQIYEGGKYDAIFVLKDHAQRFYINRGLENDKLSLENLRETLIGEEVIIKYPDHWTPLNWNKGMMHLAKLEHQGKVIYNELKS